jgi:DNA-binding MarR family transcriptional regulator
MQSVSAQSPGARLEQDVFSALLALHGRLVDQLDEELERGAGLGVGEFLVLRRLAESAEGKLRLSELAEATMVSRSALSRRVDRLVEASWVVRHGCPTDRRGTYAVITDEGRAVLGAALPIFRETLTRSLRARLDDEHLAELAALLEQAAGGIA